MKPHIQLHNGYWRVVWFCSEYWLAWHHAMKFIAKLNKQRMGL